MNRVSAYSSVSQSCKTSSTYADMVARRNSVFAAVLMCAWYRVYLEGAFHFGDGVAVCFGKCNPHGFVVEGEALHRFDGR